MTKRKRKLFLGSKIRRLREQHQLNQAEMATKLGLSASYLNQIENDQRPLTVQVLLKLGSLFDIDLAHFSEEEDDRLVAEIKDCLEDPLFVKEKLPLPELKEIVTRSPAFARHFLSLYRSYLEANHNYAGLAQNVTGDEAVRSPAAVRYCPPFFAREA